MAYPALLPLTRTPRLPVVDWTDAPADLNGLVRFAERRNMVSARVPSHFKRSLPGVFPGIKRPGREVNHLRTVPRLRMGGAIPLLPHMPSGRGPGKTVPSSYLRPQRITSPSTFRIKIMHLFTTSCVLRAHCVLTLYYKTYRLRSFSLNVFTASSKGTQIKVFYYIHLKTTLVKIA
jgi:hypothetical protein